MGDQPVVLITGTSRGIGCHLAQHFLTQGALVEGCSRQPSSIETEGYFHHVADVSDEAQVQGMLNSIRTRHGKLDICVNNAGAAGMNHFLLTPASAVDRLTAVNFKGTFLVSRESARLMRTNRYGRIVNVGTAVTALRLAGEAAYAASKGAVEHLTRVLAFELGPFGITCNAICPTLTETEMIRHVPRQKLQAILDRLAIRRFCTMEDVANAVDFLVKPESSYITGQVICFGGA